MAYDPLEDLLGGYDPRPRPAAAPIPDWRRNTTIIHRGLDPPRVYVPAQPPVGVQGAPPPGQDDYQALLAEARRPFHVAGGREYDYGGLLQEQATYDHGLQARVGPILAAMEKRDYDQGMVGAHQAQARADQTRAEAFGRQTDLEDRKFNDPVARAAILRNAGYTSDETANIVNRSGSPGAIPLPVEPERMLVGPHGTPAAPGMQTSVDNIFKDRERQGLPPILPGTPEDATLRTGPRGAELEGQLSGDFSSKDWLLEDISRFLNGQLEWATGRKYDTDRVAKQKRAMRGIGLPRARPRVAVEPTPIPPPPSTSPPKTYDFWRAFR